MNKEKNCWLNKGQACSHTGVLAGGRSQTDMQCLVFAPAQQACMTLIFTYNNNNNNNNNIACRVLGIFRHFFRHFDLFWSN